MSTPPSGAAAAARPLLFISDLHLSPSLPRTVAAFEAFVANPPCNAQALYVIGDLFEYWIGDGMLETPFARHVAALLRSLGERGIALYVMHGNRDFLLGPRFARAAGATLLAEPFVLHAFGQKFAVAHGDALCTDDRAYQRFRRVVRHPLTQRFFLWWPLRWRLALAERLRRRSRAAAPRRMTAGADVTQTAVDALVASTAAATLIHGHTHLPARHVDAAGRTRWVLPDWELDGAQPPRGGYLVLDADGVRVLPLEGSATQPY